MKIRQRQFDNWTLVLPPWGRIGYHWRERNLEQSKIPWSKFFDTEQLSRYVPTLELTDYFEEIGEEKVAEIWVGCLSVFCILSRVIVRASVTLTKTLCRYPSLVPFLDTIKVSSKL